MKKRLAIFLFLFLSFFTVSAAYGINTRDWEGMLTVTLHSAKPEKEWLLFTTYLILFDGKGSAFPKAKDQKYFEQFFDKNSNSINVPIQNKWHDLTEFKISYFKAEQGGYAYVVWYKFTKGAMTLLDVLGRYGYELAEIETKEDLSKEITYVLKSKTDTLSEPSLENPLRSLQPLVRGQVTILKFRSKDKVFIDDLIISTYKPND